MQWERRRLEYVINKKKQGRIHAQQMPVAGAARLIQGYHYLLITLNPNVSKITWHDGRTDGPSDGQTLL